MSESDWRLNLVAVRDDKEGGLVRQIMWLTLREERK